MKLLFFDLETTGVKFWRNGIHQIGGIVDIDGQEAERFDIRLAPNPAATIEQEALDVAGVTLEQVQSYQPMEDGYRQLVGILSKYVNKFDKRDKMYLVGYNNAGFDNSFLRALFQQCGVMNPSFGEIMDEYGKDIFQGNLKLVDVPKGVKDLIVNYIEKYRKL